MNFFSQGRLKINNELRGFAEVSYSSTRTDYRALPYSNSSGSPSNWFDGNTKTSQSAAKPKLAVGNPANPFNFPVGIDYRFMDNLDMWVSPSEANQYRVMVGLDGVLGEGWDWQSRPDASAAMPSRATTAPTAPRCRPQSQSGEYKIGGPNSA